MEGTTSRVNNFITFNCFGLKSNSLYVEQTILRYDCIYLTETWLLSVEEHLLNKFKRDFHIITVPARKNSSGRPFGGTALLIRRTNFIETDIIFQEEHFTTIKTVLDNSLRIFFCQV